MRILLANRSAYPSIGGVENSLRFMGRELLRAGHEVKIFCFRSSPDEPLRSEHEGLEIVRCPYVARRWPHARLHQQVDVARREIRPLLQEFRPDAVWSRSTTIGMGIAGARYAGPLFQIFCTNISMDCLGLYWQTSGMPAVRRLMLLGLWPLHYRAGYRIERDLTRRCQPVVFSENMRSQLRQLYGSAAGDILLIPPGIEASVFSPAHGARLLPEIEEKYGLRASRELHVLYVGRLSAAKNIPLLIDAMAQCHRQAKLVLVGSGPEEARIRSYAQRAGMLERIVFAGPQDRLLAGFYAMATLTVLPTTIESFGQVFLESLACGTPAIGFVGDGRRVRTATAEIVRDGETGRTVRDATPAALAGAIDSILGLSTANYEAMSQRAVADVVSRFDWSQFVTRMLAVSTNGQQCVEQGV